MSIRAPMTLDEFTYNMEQGIPLSIELKKRAVIVISFI